MQIEPTELDKAVLLKVSGRMDAESAPLFEQACEQWIARGRRHRLPSLKLESACQALGRCAGCEPAVQAAAPVLGPLAKGAGYERGGFGSVF